MKILWGRGWEVFPLMYCTVLYSRLLECMRSSVNLWCYLLCPTSVFELQQITIPHCNLPEPYYTQTPLSLYHLAFDSPTHSAIQRLTLPIPFFLSLSLFLSHTHIYSLSHTHATSQMGSILWTRGSSWADTLTDTEKLIPSSQDEKKKIEPMTDC